MISAITLSAIKWERRRLRLIENLRGALVAREDAMQKLTLAARTRELHQQELEHARVRLQEAASHPHGLRVASLLNLRRQLSKAQQSLLNAKESEGVAYERMSEATRQAEVARSSILAAQARCEQLLLRRDELLRNSQRRSADLEEDECVATPKAATGLLDAL